ncbi:MAG: ABC transporter ATP-binding protein [Candidatus Methanomethylophilaceae archaeon]|nr:ABC transporter ATP-binding protein [Candidatus Methanomethylophilaceae archaeon]
MAPPGPRWTKMEKPKDLMGSFRDLVSYMGPMRRGIALGLVFSVLAAVMSLIGPQVLARITDALSADIMQGIPFEMGYVTRLCLMLVMIYAAGMLFSTVEQYLIMTTSERIGAMMRRDLATKLDRLPIGFLDSRETGDVMSRMTNDSDTVSSSCGNSINHLIIAVTMLVGSLAMMLYTEWRLAVVAVIPATIGFFVLFTFTRRTQRFFRSQQRDLGSMNTLVEEVYHGHDIVRLYNNTEETASRFSDINDSLFESGFKARFITGMMPQMMGFIGNLGYVIVCVVGSAMVLEGMIGYGVIVAFIVYIRQFTHPIVQISDSTAQLQSVVSASERVFEFLDEPEMPDQPDDPDFVFGGGRVEFRGVRFGYQPGREIIHGLDLVVGAGSKVAIVGPTGSGKTTIANLLMRFYEVDDGEILIDGTPVSRLSRSQLRGLFSMVLQDSWLFDGTVAENIAFSRTDAPRSAIEDAARAVGIDRFVSTLPDGYDTAIGNGSGLSMGQRQQIAIARAIVRDAPMVIMDEATSSVDTRTERTIQEAMAHLTEGRTSFVIAHRLSTIRDSDVILVVRDGDIVEKGTHEELLALGGFYKELYDSQFENCE